MLISQSTRFSELQSRLHGQVLTDTDEAWDSARQTFNVLVDQRPAAVVRVANADDVAETIRYASQRGLRVAPQGTGHNAGPMDGLEDALLLRTDALQGVKVDAVARRARVGAGVRWGAVADAAGEANLVALHGSSRTVGVAGYSLGGGIGWLARKHGLQSNALTAIEIVTADGELRRIDHDNDTDLFWAVRGGGGNYGVVTALEFDLFTAPEIYAGALFFPFERAPEVMHAWHELVSAGLPEEITTVARVYQFPPLPFLPEFIRGKSFTVVQAAYLGNESDGADLIRPLTELGPDMNTFGMVGPDALGHLAMDPQDPIPAASATRIVSNATPATIDAFLDSAGPGSPSGLASVELRSLGGALARRPEGAGARATLQGDYVMFAVGGVMTPEAQGEVQGQADGVSAALAPWDAGARYANFEERSSDARLFYDEDTFRLLRALRTEWDPSGLFLANHEIKE
ncbi:MAG TPA: FAD-binding oxidoreductase [Thermoleophilaceae bacterium]|jgi:FAD binding domain-containing protein|nr:FAD-binding oxidoreductase [Thermoleophilaceae bacterium]